MKILVGDFECDSLDPTLIHCAAFKSYPDGTWYEFKQDECYSQELKDLLNSCDFLVGHNFVSFDLPKVIRRFIDKDFPLEKIRDSLILSRMFKADRIQGHGLESWGEQLGVLKPGIDDWSKFTPEMLDRVKKDVEINYRLYEKLKREFKTTDRAVKLEHYSQHELDKMGDFGFWFDLPSADILYAQICSKEDELLKQLQQDFPQHSVAQEHVTLRTKKVIKTFVDSNGNPIKELNPTTGRMINKKEETLEKYTLGNRKIPLDNVVGDFSFLEWEKFNPGSPEQCCEVLHKAGWDPLEKTKGHKKAEQDYRKEKNPQKKQELKQKLDQYKIYGWVVSNEENLATLPDTAPESIKNLGHYLIVRNRKARLEEWFEALGEDQRIHGSVISIGAKTHRCSHKRPNQANIPAIKKKGKINYMGKEFRSLWRVPNNNELKTQTCYKTNEERRIVGVDAEGIQLRILCHLMKDPSYTKQVISGDPHSYNMFAAGIDPGFPLDYDKLHQEIIKKHGRLITPNEALILRLGKPDLFDWSGRDVSKTFLYAYLLGAGNGKIKQITGIDGQSLKDKFYKEIPSLYDLQEVWIPSQIAQGYTLGVDGRHFTLDGVPKHKVLSILLQGNEAIIMKLAMYLITREFRNRDLDAQIVAFVHDEFQIDCALSCAEEVKKIAVDAIRISGEILNLDCPMQGKGMIGLSWADSH